MSEHVFQVGELVYSSQDRAEVTISNILTGDEAYIQGPSGAGYRDLSTLQALEPRPGDRVRVTQLMEDSTFLGRAFPSSRVDVGSERTLESIKRHSSDPSWSVVELNGIEMPGACRVLLLSRAAAEGPKGDLYESGCMLCGGDHDLRLCVGDRGEAIRWCGDCSDQWKGSASREIARRKSLAPKPSEPSAPGKGWEPKVGERVYGVGAGSERYCFVGSYRHRAPHFGGSEAIDIGGGDIRYVRSASLRSAADETCGQYETDCYNPISPPPGGSADAPAAVTAASPVPSGGGSSKPDPYAEHRRVLANNLCLGNAGVLVLESYVAAQQSQDDSRLAATRRRHLDQASHELDRPTVRGRHDWDCDAGSESELRVS